MMSDQRRWIMFLALATGALSGLLVGEARAKPKPLFGFNDDLAVQLEHRAFARASGPTRSGCRSAGALSPRALLRPTPSCERRGSVRSST